MTIQSIKGFKDILPDEIPPWEFAEAVLRRLFKSFRYLEIRLPVLEETALFDRSIGTGTDIVEKEMYTFDDRDGKRISLRPEGTASVIRAYIEHHLKGTLPLVKLFYMGPMFRHERPQKGRFRQFHQTGAEAIGDSGPLLDAEQIFLLSLFFEEIGIKEARLEINSVGCSNCRPPYKKILQDYLRKKENALCENCRRRIETNPLRVLDCKGESCQEALKDAPEILRYLCEECASHFGEVKKGLEALKIPFWINPRLVRGLDYYTKTAFEWKAENLGAQNTIAAGGRYDGLVEELGGEPTSGIGFAIGMERTLSLMDRSRLKKEPLTLFIAALGDPAREISFPILAELRRNGVSADMDYQGSSLKSQMKKADRCQARYVLIIGASEIERRKGILRDMNSKVQVDLDLSGGAGKILSYLSEKTDLSR